MVLRLNRDELMHAANTPIIHSSRTGRTCAKVSCKSSFSDWFMVLYGVLVCPAQHERHSGLFATSTQELQSQNVDNEHNQLEELTLYDELLLKNKL